jgi:glutamyl-tRNA synthetase
MTVRVRFAPSPTGFLHIGGARTALFNWLFAKHHGGEFYLRIEDTDRQRSTQAAIDAILDGLQWLGLAWDGEVVYQFARAARHAEVAHELVAKGEAYYCYCTAEELEAMRAEAEARGEMFRYDRRWRDRPASDAPQGIPPVIRLKAPLTGETVVEDLVQGRVTVQNSTLDDMVLLRSDGTPTYMLSVVVDDHDMGITHVLRGDDHLTNAFRQSLLYRACGWEIPAFGHIPLIHGADGAKLSKRHGALGAEAYREMGFLPEALRNYLLRLGWAHGDEEIISTEQAIAWFTTDGIGRSPSRFDLTKLEHLNGHYLRSLPPEVIVERLTPFLEALEGRTLTASERDVLERGLEGLRQRAKTLMELAENARFYVRPLPLPMGAKAQAILEAQAADREALVNLLSAHTDWSQTALHDAVKHHAETQGKKLGDMAAILRVLLTGSTVSPSVFEILVALGREKSVERLHYREGV